MTNRYRVPVIVNTRGAAITRAKSQINTFTSSEMDLANMQTTLTINNRTTLAGRREGNCYNPHWLRINQI